MFPNEHQPENKVREGQLVKVPAAGQGWCLPASLPRGKDSEWNLVVALFSSEEVNYCRDGGPGTDAGPLKMLPKWSRPFLPTGKPAFEAAGTKMLLIDRSPSAQ